jgi:hypothetical protein
MIIHIDFYYILTTIIGSLILYFIIDNIWKYSIIYTLKLYKFLFIKEDTIYVKNDKLYTKIMLNNKVTEIEIPCIVIKDEIYIKVEEGNIDIFYIHKNNKTYFVINPFIKVTCKLNISDDFNSKIIEFNNELITDKLNDLF